MMELIIMFSESFLFLLMNTHHYVPYDYDVICMTHRLLHLSTKSLVTHLKDMAPMGKLGPARAGCLC